MTTLSGKLRGDAERIWRAGVAAVLPERLVPEQVHVDGDWLTVGDETIELKSVKRIAIVGAGKAVGAMAVALEIVLGPRLLEKKQLTGWVNVPANCLVETQRVHVHAARAAGVNVPSQAGVEGTERIVQIVSSLGPTDICFCLLTGGGSALMPATAPGISLDDKVRVTSMLSGAGANIEQLNTVRQHVSRVKGGGLARACRAGRLITLVISDVLGDRLDIVASGPTFGSTTTAADALCVLDTLKLSSEPSISAVVRYLQREAAAGALAEELAAACTVSHFILGNNAMAVDAAGVEAERLGYSHAMVAATKPEGAAEGVGRHLAGMARRMREQVGPNCLISGGEPTVTLVDAHRRGNGGRNQQLALAALAALDSCERICLLSAGTDGEDGPTDAAGAFATDDIARAAEKLQLNAEDYLARNDAYTFFQQCDGLLITGPTQTNVCDLRILLVDQ